MFSLKVIGLSLALISPAFISAQYYQQPQQNGAALDNQYQPAENYNKPPPPQILSHKQALNHDGNFRYLFTSDNGLAQGETIAPDGSRNGGYSYVDPNGKKISVKYTAGKEGFRILEADHLPKAPLPAVPVPGAGLPVGVPQQQQYAPQRYTAQQDDGQYRPQSYAQPQPRPYAAAPLVLAQPSISRNVNAQQQEIDYNDEPGKPHSFGNGYVFEFAG